MTARVPSQRPPSLAGADWLIRPETQAVFAALAAAGHAARAVGGAVRNSLIGRPASDVDIATTATPDEVMAAAAAAGLHAVPTGIAHGTVTVVSGHEPFEVTTLREDVESFGRHARVAFTADWVSDAHRRDFTMNALYCDAAGGVLDPVGGYPDLLAGEVRFIGDPTARIGEDRLRILRFFRFNAEYGHGAPDRSGLAACVAARSAIRSLSGERVRAELLRLLAAPRAPAMLAVMADTAILPEVLGLDAEVGPLAALAALEQTLGRAPDPLLRLASLLPPAADQAPPAAIGLADRLRLSLEEQRRLTAATAGPPFDRPVTAPDAVDIALYRLGPAPLADRLLLDWARAADPPDHPARTATLQAAARRPVPVMPVRGADVLALGVPPGPRVGRILAAFETWWLNSGLPQDLSAARRRLATLAAIN